MNENYVIGVDIGGSHITVSAVDLQSRALIPNTLVRAHVDTKGDAESIFNAWSAAISECKNLVPNLANKIGIAMPGPFDYETGVSLIKDLDKLEAIYNLNVKNILANRLAIGATDIKMMNDAECFLRGEVFSIAERTGKNVLGITLGTGLGSSFYVNKKFKEGDMYYYPYLASQAEDYLSTRWFVKAYQELTGKTVKNVKEIVAQFAENNNLQQLFDTFGTNLGNVLQVYIQKYEIDEVVIGGNLTKTWDLFMPSTNAVLAKHNLNASIVASTLGEEAALLGAATL